MPYSPSHKLQSRNKILQSAYRLFASKGYDNVSIDELMERGGFTRGAFYAHFKNKAELYREALQFGVRNSVLVAPNTEASPLSLEDLIEHYLHPLHVKGEHPCPLAFLATDVAVREKSARKTYTNSFLAMTEIIAQKLDKKSAASQEEVQALMAMMIGAVAVLRNIADEALLAKILAAAQNIIKDNLV